MQGTGRNPWIILESEFERTWKEAVVASFKFGWMVKGMEQKPSLPLVYSVSRDISRKHAKSVTL
jgi:hypothetical protein